MTFLTEIPDDEFFGIEEDIPADEQDLIELRVRASALGVKNVNNLDINELEQRIKILLNVKREGLSRLEFDENRELVPSLENLRILQIEAEQKKSSLTREDVIQKLQGYRLLTDKLNTTNRRWTRYIDKEDGFLRAGGFPIRNEPSEEFIVMKNVSKRFTFSINRAKVILMEKLPKGSIELISQEGQQLVIDFVNRSGSGTNFVALKDDFSVVHRANNNTALSRLIQVNRGALGRKFRANSGKHKDWFLFKLSLGDFNDLNEMIPLQNANLSGIPDDLQAVIDRYYPGDIDISILDTTDEESELSEEFDDEKGDEPDGDDEDGDQFLLDLLGEVIEEEEGVEDIIVDLSVSIINDPDINPRMKKLVLEIDIEDLRDENDKSSYIRILKNLKAKELLERDDGLLLKVIRDRSKTRRQKEEDDNIIDILRRGEAQGISPVDNVELLQLGVDMGTIIRLTFTMDRQEEKEQDIQQGFIEQFREQLLEDPLGRPPLVEGSLEFWINKMLGKRRHLGEVKSAKQIKEILDERQNDKGDIGRKFSEAGIRKASNRLAEKRYLLKLGGLYSKAN